MSAKSQAASISFIGPAYRIGSRLPGHAFGALLGAAMCLCLVAQPLRLQVGAVHTSALELWALAMFVWTLASPVARQNPLWMPYFCLLLSAIPAISLGLFQNAGIRVARDATQLLYPACFFAVYQWAGTGDGRRRALLRMLCGIFALFTIGFLAASRFAALESFIPLQSTFRILAVAACLLALASLSKIGPVQLFTTQSSLVLFLIAVGFLLQMRTRAVYVMMLVSLPLLLIKLFAATNRRGRVLRTLTWLAALAAAVWVVGADTFANPDSATKRLASLSVDTYREDATIAYRLEAWRFAWTSFVESPLLGKGFGDYIILDPWLRGETDYYPAMMIHNTPLQILYNGGVVHMAGYLIFLCGALARLRARGLDADFRVVAFPFVIGYIAYSIFSVTLFKPTEVLVFWCLLGLMVGGMATGGAGLSTRLAPRRTNAT